MSISEHIANSYASGKKPKVNINNKFTRKRMKLYENIKENTGENPDSELDFSRQIIGENLPKVQRYIMSQNETPSDNLDNLIKQAYSLRCNQINAISSSLDISDRDAQILIEEDEHEANEIEANGKDEFLAELFAPIGIAATRLQMKHKKDQAEAENLDGEADNLSGDLGNILGGVLGIAGTKISAGDFKRAAQNKPAGVLGALGAGGTSHYNALRSWFSQYPKIAALVVSGQIPDEASLYYYVQQQNVISQGGAKISMPPVSAIGSTPINSNDIVGGIADYQKKQALKKALPLIIIGAVALIIVIVLIARKK
jgi:hypothetical protein